MGMDEVDAINLRCGWVRIDMLGKWIGWLAMHYRMNYVSTLN